MGPCTRANNVDIKSHHSYQAIVWLEQTSLRAVCAPPTLDCVQGLFLWSICEKKDCECGY